MFFLNHNIIKIASRILFDAFRDFPGSHESKRKRLEAMADEELVKLCQGELPYQTDAFEVLMNRYRQRVFGKILSMLRRREDANDVLQDVFIKVYNALPKFQMKSSFSTWVYTITVNTTLNYIDKMQRRPLWWITEDVTESNRSELEDKQLFFAVDQGLEREDLRKQIAAAMENLSEASRKIIQLRYYEELDYKSIAEALDLGLSATKMRLKRAREEFRNHYEMVLEEE